MYNKDHKFKKRRKKTKARKGTFFSDASTGHHLQYQLWEPHKGLVTQVILDLFNDVEY